MSVSIRRAREDDVEFLVELVSHQDVEPFIGAVSARESEAVRAEIARSEAESHDFGRFIIEADGERAGAMGFELANRRSRIAHLERLAVHPSFRGRQLADEAARLLQGHLFRDLGYHRLQLEIYGFNERAQRHAERAGFVREGTRRAAYWRHGTWTDGVLYALLAEEAGISSPILLLHEYLGVHNDCVRIGDWQPLRAYFRDDATLEFDGLPIGPFRGVDEIVAAYVERPPDDVVLTFTVEQAGESVTAAYGWLREPAAVTGRILMTPLGDRIARLVITVG